MPQLDRSYSAGVKDSGGVLLGVAQVRVGKASIREAGTAVVGTPVAVGKSTIKSVTMNGQTVEVVKPATTYAANGATSVAFTVSGAYTATYDGAFILRAASSGSIEVFAPNGYKHASTITVAGGTWSAFTLNIAAGTPAGPTVAGAVTGTMAAGDTWIIPVTTASSRSTNQTGIVCPWSILSNAESVGGLKGSKLGFNVGGIEKLTAGLPEVTYDQIIKSTSVNISFDSLEFNNSSIQILRNMMNEVINNGNIAAISMEVVARTRGGNLYTYFAPSVTYSKFPDIAPQDSFSTATYEFEASKQTEITPADPLNPTAAENTYNAWLSEAPLFQECRHLH